jgi:sporulation protein YlmC with PRC-barrel domain
MYKDRIAELQREASYKEDILEDKRHLMEKHQNERRNYEEKAIELKRHKEEIDQEYEEKTNVLRMEAQHHDGAIRERIHELNREKQVQLELIDNKMGQLEKEKMHQDELYKIQVEKIQQDQLYQERMNQIKNNTLLMEQQYGETQEHLLRERETLGASIADTTTRERIPSLKRLKEIEDEFEVADKHLDVRGWEVLGNNGEKIGKVDELIVDLDAMKVRYLDLDVDNIVNAATGERETRHVLIPIGAATIDKADDNVYIPNLDRAMVMKCPSYTGETVTRDYEQTLLTTLSPDYNLKTANRTDFYASEHFDDKRFYSSRTVEKKKSKGLFKR